MQGQTTLTRRALKNLRQVACPSKARIRTAGTSQQARTVRLWGSLTARMLFALDRATILFSHLCSASVVLLQVGSEPCTEPDRLLPNTVPFRIAF